MYGFGYILLLLLLLFLNNGILFLGNVVSFLGMYAQGGRSGYFATFLFFLSYPFFFRGHPVCDVSLLMFARYIVCIGGRQIIYTPGLPESSLD